MAIGAFVSGPDQVPTLSATAARGLRAWTGLALIALAVAGVFALLLALSRTPGIDSLLSWPAAFFGKGLVIHVVFSFVIWLLAVFGALLHVATERTNDPRFPGLGHAPPLMVGGAMPLLFIPAFLDRGAPSLNNYVPVIVDPIYYAGLALLALGITLAVVRLLLSLIGQPRPMNPPLFAMGAAAGIFICACVTTGFSLVILMPWMPSIDFNETLFWGSGHVLQFLNAALLVTAWGFMARLTLGGPRHLGKALKAATAWLLLAAIAGPALYVTAAGIREPAREIFTNLQFIMAPPTLLIAALLSWHLLHEGRAGKDLPWRNPVFLCLVLSPIVFGIGGVLGLFVDGADARTPAHYHGVIAGLNLALMGLFYGLFLPLLRRSAGRGRIVYVQIWLFAAGQMTASIGLFLAGGHGTQRKVAGAAQDLQGIAEISGMALNGIGALFAVVGGILFIWTAARALIGPPAQHDA